MLFDVLFRACHLPPSTSDSRHEEVILLRDADQCDFGALLPEMWHNSFLQRQDFVFLPLRQGLRFLVRRLPRALGCGQRLVV